MRFIAALFALVVLISPASSEPPVLAVIDFFPFGYRDRDGQEKGMFFDMSAAIAKETGIDIEARLSPVPRAVRNASTGKVDFLISYKDPLMVPNVLFVGNLGCLTAYVIHRKGTRIQTLQDLNNRRIGLIAGGYFQNRFHDRLPYEEVLVTSNQAMLKLLIRGRLDGFVINSAVFDAFYHLDTPNPLPEGWRDALAPPLRIETLETHLSIAMNSPMLEHTSKITGAIRTLNERGVMADIFAKYGSTDRGSCVPGQLMAH